MEINALDKHKNELLTSVYCKIIKELLELAEISFSTEEYTIHGEVCEIKIKIK